MFTRRSELLQAGHPLVHAAHHPPTPMVCAISLNCIEICTLTEVSASDDVDLPIPGAFPQSPPPSPSLLPARRRGVAAGLVDEDRDIPMADLDSAAAKVYATPELPTELGSHLHPRRPSRLTPTPTRANRLPSVRPRAARKENELLVDDPWSRQSLAFEKFPFGRPVSAVQLFYPEKKPLPADRIESIFASEWQKRERERRARERDLRRPARVIPQGAAVRPLSWPWLDRVSQAMKSADNHKVAVLLSGDALVRKDIATCITPLAWLNDEIINAYLSLLVDYLCETNGNVGRNQQPRFHAFNTFFYSNLRDKGYQAVRRWANRAKIGGQALLNVDTVFVPVHESSHWTLLVVRPCERTIEYFDSLGARGMRQFKIIKDWLRGELGTKFDEEDWTLLPSISSLQDNGSDCGAFLLSNAKAITIGIDPVAFGASDINMLRKKIVAELMNGGLRGEFDPIQKGGTMLL